MSNLKCPNCQQFKFSKNSGRTEWGIGCVIFFPIVLILLPGISGFYGGSTSSSDTGTLIIVSVAFGIFLWISKLIFPSQTETYSCSNCKYVEKYLKK